MAFMLHIKSKMSHKSGTLYLLTTWKAAPAAAARRMLCAAKAAAFYLRSGSMNQYSAELNTTVCIPLLEKQFLYPCATPCSPGYLKLTPYVKIL